MNGVARLREMPSAKNSMQLPALRAAAERQR